MMLLDATCRKLRNSAIAMPMMAAKTISSRSNHVSLRNPRAMIMNINSAKMASGMYGNKAPSQRISCPAHGRRGARDSD